MTHTDSRAYLRSAMCSQKRSSQVWRNTRMFTRWLTSAKPNLLACVCQRWLIPSTNWLRCGLLLIIWRIKVWLCRVSCTVKSAVMKKLRLWSRFTFVTSSGECSATHESSRWLRRSDLMVIKTLLTRVGTMIGLWRIMIRRNWALLSKNWKLSPIQNVAIT